MNFDYRNISLATFCAASAFQLVACGSDGSSPGATTETLNDGTKPDREGYVVVVNDKSSTGEEHSIFALFSTLPPPFTQECKTYPEGSCTAEVCGPVSLPSPGWEIKKFAAGVIEISGARISPAIRLEPVNSTQYPELSLPGLVWSGGEDIRFRAAGQPGGVPAFEATLKAPSLITVTAPVWGDSLSVDRSKDLAISWTLEGAASGVVAARFTTDTSSGSTTVTCRYPAADKHGTIPSASLKRLTPASGAGFDVELNEEKHLQVGDWPVRLALLSHASRPGGGLASTGVTLE